MTTVPPADDWDVIAYGENHEVLMVWTNTPDVTTLAELPANNRMSRMVIETAELIRRRDGFVLKSRDGVIGFPEAESQDIVLPDPNEPKVRELKRVELIPPPTELPEHEALSREQLISLALHIALCDSDTGQVSIDDRDIVRALTNHFAISFETTANGVMIFRAHVGRLEVVPIAGNPEADAISEAKQAAYADAIDVLDEVFTRGEKVPTGTSGYKAAVNLLRGLMEAQADGDG